MFYTGSNSNHWRNCERSYRLVAPPDDNFPPSVLGGESPSRLMDVESIQSSNPGCDGRLSLISGPPESSSSVSYVPEDFDIESVWSENQHLFDQIEGLISNFNPEYAQRPVKRDDYVVPPKYGDSTDASTSTGAGTGSLSVLSSPPYVYSGSTTSSSGRTATYVIRRVVVLVKDAYTQVTEEQQDSGFGNYGLPYEVTRVSFQLVCLNFEILI